MPKFKPSDRRLCRWYGHAGAEVIETTVDPPCVWFRCSRCSALLGGPFTAGWGGRKLGVQELAVRSIFKPSAFFTELTKQYRAAGE